MTAMKPLIETQNARQEEEKKEDEVKEEIPHTQLKRRKCSNNTSETNNNHKNGSKTVISRDRARTNSRTNPFKLIPCEKYENELKAPFVVRFSLEALIIVDIHAHLVSSEVIGLLGGTFCKQTNVLTIVTSEPCVTIDDDNLQCEMEPVSQAMASERLQKRGFEVVGWYHSHPTFSTDPSLRDLETQSKYQELFSLENEKPFIAMILSPYSTLNSKQSANTNNLISKYKLITVVTVSDCDCFGHNKHNQTNKDNQTNHHESSLDGLKTNGSQDEAKLNPNPGVSPNPNHSQLTSSSSSAATSSTFALPCQQHFQRIPYQLSPVLIRREKMMISVTNALKELCEGVKEKQTAVAMLEKIKRFRSGDMTYLNKLSSSIKHHMELVGLSQVESGFLVAQVESIIKERGYLLLKKKNQSKYNNQNYVTNNHH